MRCSSCTPFPEIHMWQATLPKRILAPAGGTAWWAGQGHRYQHLLCCLHQYFGQLRRLHRACLHQSGHRRLLGAHLPMVTIGDMVRAQKHLIDHLGITKLLSLVGGSVGGMQVLQWCVDYPHMVRSAIPLATTSRHSARPLPSTKWPARRSWPIRPGTWVTTTTVLALPMGLLWRA